MRIVCIIITVMNQRILQYSALSSTVGLHALVFVLMGGAVAMQQPITLPRVASMEMISLAAPSKAAAPAAPKQQPKPEKKPTPQVKPTPTPKPTPVKPKVMATPTPAAPSAKAISVPTAAPAAESKPSPAANSAEGGSSRGQSADAKPSITEPMYRGGYLNNPSLPTRRCPLKKAKPAPCSCACTCPPRASRWTWRWPTAAASRGWTAPPWRR